MLRRISRYLARRRLKDPAYAFLFEPGPADEAVSVDCETTGLDRRKDEIVSVAAVRIRGRQVLTSEAFTATVRCKAAINPTAIKVHGLRERDVAMGQAMADVLPELIKFIGGRPLVGYYIEFDAAMINRYLRAWLGIGLPNRQLEVSGLYYDRKYGDAPPGTHVDLSFASIARDLGIDLIDQHDALADATTAALMHVMLSDLQARRVRIPRAPYTPTTGFSGG
jgi:DNA polymerase-3 subunit epsilon